MLFLAVYALAGSVASSLTVNILASKFFAVPSEGSTLDSVLILCTSVLTGFLGVILGTSALGIVMKDYSARGIGLAFVSWWLIQYSLHFLFFSHSKIIPDFEIYNGLLQGLVAIATTWYVFRLPPFRPQANAAPIVDEGLQPTERDRGTLPQTDPKPPPVRGTSASFRGNRMSPEVEAVFEKLDRLMNDDKAQVEGLPDVNAGRNPLFFGGT